ncbi:DivIVA domain-containing protein [Proteocatella sphenisci]|uniref:DivIVA domain-containing protein n=1 Tax=Proteocatella sphenisci TaxID=181070 RepID=UPI00049195CB|nr:DivIVA domain-containing protein [Proteocatella sphenisci]
MLTPLDIENREFRKTMRGYNDQEVDRFMDEVKLDYEKIYKENSDLKLKLEYLKEQLESYKNLENSIKDTLIISKKTAEDIHINAGIEKELIIKEAQVNAKNIISSANNEVVRIQNEYEDIRKEFILFKNKMTTLMGDVSLKSDILDKKFEQTQRINVIKEDMLDKKTSI